MSEKVNKLTDDIVNEQLYAEIVHVPKLEVVEDKITNKNLNFPMRNTTDEQKQNWENLVNSIKGCHADKFNEILLTLSQSKPLEFARLYLKSLEFVAPKLIRTDGSDGVVKDNNITVVIKR
jgi:hypothetical protein